MRAKRLTQALECFENAIKVNPKNAIAWFKKGTILHKQMKFQEALSYYNTALSIDPSLEEAEDQRIELVLDMGPDEDESDDFPIPSSDSSPEEWERYEQKKALNELKVTIFIRFLGVIFFIFAGAFLISFIVSMVYSVKYSVPPDLGDLFSSILNVLMGVVMFIIARKFEKIADFLKKHVFDKSE